MNKPTILVTGAAGYIGSTTALLLKEQGFGVVIVDNLSTGFKETAAALALPFFEGDVGDAELIARVAKLHTPSAAVHFAAHAYVGESVTDPAKYYSNNVVQSMRLFGALLENGIKKIVFSSTCATYGIVNEPIAETNSQNPISPYGRSKLMVENILSDYSKAYDLSYIAFRYFNVAGAHPSLLVGERHNPETHLIPRAIFATMGKKELELFGTDYPTPDGSCIRDYVHVVDIASAHILGLEHLLNNKPSDLYNIGTGTGTSVLQVIEAVQSVSGKKVPWKAHPRRAGDPPLLVASSKKIQSELGWKPQYGSINAIVESAYRWYEKHPELIC